MRERHGRGHFVHGVRSRTSGWRAERRVELDRANSATERQVLTIDEHIAADFINVGHITAVWTDGTHTSKADSNQQLRPRSTPSSRASTTVAIETWLNALPADIIRPHDRAAAIQDVLTGIPHQGSVLQPLPTLARSAPDSNSESKPRPRQRADGSTRDSRPQQAETKKRKPQQQPLSLKADNGSSSSTTPEGGGDLELRGRSQRRQSPRRIHTHGPHPLRPDPDYTVSPTLPMGFVVGRPVSAGDRPIEGVPAVSEKGSSRGGWQRARRRVSCMPINAIAMITSTQGTTSFRVAALPAERHPASFAPWSTPYIACTRATATNPTITPTKMIMIGSNIVVKRLIRLSSSRSK